MSWDGEREEEGVSERVVVVVDMGRNTNVVVVTLIAFSLLCVCYCQFSRAVCRVCPSVRPYVNNPEKQLKRQFWPA